MTTTVRASEYARKKFVSEFLVDTGATDSLVPAKELKRVGIKRRGRMAYELADGQTVEYDFGLAEIEFMGELTSGRVIFGPDDAEPLLGVTALESVGILVDPANRTLKRMPAIPLKSAGRLRGVFWRSERNARRICRRGKQTSRLAHFPQIRDSAG